MKKILIVDDEKEMCSILSQYFLEEGYDVDTAFDAYEALNKAKNYHYNYLVVDLVLPGGMNGMDIIKKFKKSSPSTHIIAYSGFCDSDITERVISAGANNFIAKPFKHKDLFSLMSHRN